MPLGHRLLVLVLWLKNIEHHQIGSTEMHIWTFNTSSGFREVMSNLKYSLRPGVGQEQIKVSFLFYWLNRASTLCYGFRCTIQRLYQWSQTFSCHSPFGGPTTSRFPPWSVGTGRQARGLERQKLLQILQTSTNFLMSSSSHAPLKMASSPLGLGTVGLYTTGVLAAWRLMDNDRVIYRIQSNPSSHNGNLSAIVHTQSESVVIHTFLVRSLNQNSWHDIFICILF